MTHNKSTREDMVFFGFAWSNILAEAPEKPKGGCISLETFTAVAAGAAEFTPAQAKHLQTCENCCGHEGQWAFRVGKTYLLAS